MKSVFIMSNKVRQSRKLITSFEDKSRFLIALKTNNTKNNNNIQDRKRVATNKVSRLTNSKHINLLQTDVYILWFEQQNKLVDILCYSYRKSKLGMIIVAEKEDLSKYLIKLKTSITNNNNKTKGQIGSVFEGRAEIKEIKTVSRLIKESLKINTPEKGKDFECTSSTAYLDGLKNYIINKDLFFKLAKTDAFNYKIMLDNFQKKS